MQWMRLVKILPSLALGALATLACEDEHDVPVRRVANTEQVSAKRSLIDRQELERAEGNWKPLHAWEMRMEARNPFRGFSDTLLAELMQREQQQEEGDLRDVQLPEQLYASKDYRLIGVITGTAEPKAVVVDPGGNRFILRRGSLLGNNNGRVIEIRRDRIEVFEHIAGEGRYIDIALYLEDEQKIQILVQ